MELYGFSEYWFSVDDVLNLGGVYNHDQFEEKAKDFCKQTWKAIKVGRFTAMVRSKIFKIRTLVSKCKIFGSNIRTFCKTPKNKKKTIYADFV